MDGSWRPREPQSLKRVHMPRCESTPNGRVGSDDVLSRATVDMSMSAPQPPLGNDDLIELLRRMLRLRRFDERAAEAVQSGQIAGGFHGSVGQEGEIAGAGMALRRDDYIVGNHRSHGHPIGKGAALTGLMAELFGRVTGVNRGKGGSMHLADFSVGSLGETSITGSGVPVAVGAALGARLQGSDRVALCFFGDGASNEGAVHEGMNLAAIWKLPVIFLCENNGYAVSTPVTGMVPVADIACRASGYGMPGVVVDGQDALAVHEAVAAAVGRARNGEGPTLIEAKTYRYMEHAVGLIIRIPYRTEEEIERWRERDPITLLRTRLVADEILSSGAADRLAQEVDDEVTAAIEFAAASPYPEAHEASEGLYAKTREDV